MYITEASAARLFSRDLPYFPATYYFLVASISHAISVCAVGSIAIAVGRRIRELIGGPVFAMFHLDYLSCFLTVLATILLARKSWIGLLIAIVNSLIVCAIGLRTSQLGFIPANLFCICIYAFSMRPWLKEQRHTNRDQAQAQDCVLVARGRQVSLQSRNRSDLQGVPRRDHAKLLTIQSTPHH